MTTTHDSTRPRAHSDVRVGPDEPGLPPRRLPTWARILLAVVTMFTAAFSPAVVGLIPDVDARFRALPDPLAGLAIIAMYSLAMLTTLLLVWLLMRFVDRRPFSDIGWTWNARTLPAFGAGLTSTIVLVLLAGLAGATLSDPRPAETPGGAGTPLWLVILAGLATAFLLQGIGEEVIWRGYVFQTLRTPPVVTAYISATLFALLHLVSQGGQQNAWEHVVYLAIPFGFALLAGALVLRTGSLWAAIGVHGGFHVATLIDSLWLEFGTGPVMWAAQGLVLAAAGAALIHLRRRDTPATT